MKETFITEHQKVSSAIDKTPHDTGSPAYLSRHLTSFNYDIYAVHRAANNHQAEMDRSV